MIFINWADIVIVVLVLLSMIIGLVRGFVREVFSLATWLLGCWVAFQFYENLSVVLEKYITQPSLRHIVSFSLLFIAVLILGTLVAHLFRQLVDKTGLKSSDRFLGMFFGLARGILVVILLILLLGYTPATKDSWWQESYLIPYLQKAAKLIQAELPSGFQTPTETKILPEKS